MTLPSCRGDEFVVDENDTAAFHQRVEDFGELVDVVGRRVHSLPGFVLEDEEVQELRRIARCLDRGVLQGSRLALFDAIDERPYCSQRFSHTILSDLKGGSLVDRHLKLPVSSLAVG